MTFRSMRLAAVTLVAFAAPAFSQFGGGGIGGGGLGGGGLGGGGMGGQGGFGGGQGGFGGGQGGQGGIILDPQGVLRSVPKKQIPNLAVELPEELKGRASLRQVSLKGLDGALRQAIAANPKAPRFAEPALRLAGLSRIEFVVFDKENDDVLLCGPAEEWTVAPDGRAIGKNSQRPTLHLLDVVTALRSAFAADGRVSCTIMPSQEGLAQFRKFKAPATDGSPEELAALRKQLAAAIGMQEVGVAGVPNGSRFALALVDADYLMKRIAHGLEKVGGVVTQLDSLAEAGENPDRNRLTRWWFTSDYDGIRKDEAGRTFQFIGAGMKLEAETLDVAENGEAKGLGFAESAQEKFAKTFNANREKLERRFPAFADLHNLYDLVLAAGLVKEVGAPSWLAKSPLLDDEQYRLPTATVPKLAEPVVQFRIGSGALLLATGGVTMEPKETLATGIKTGLKTSPPALAAGPSTSGRFWSDAGK
jgi:hypothetical protein